MFFYDGFFKLGANDLTKNSRVPILKENAPVYSSIKRN